MMNFSAFKLFYDSFLYRNNVMIEYDAINNYLNEIIKVLKKATKLYHDDKGKYVDSLTAFQAQIKDELDKIMRVYPYFFEKYYELYDRNVENNDTVTDMPFIIACSFYNDYGSSKVLDDYVERLSSLDKKRLRNRAKNSSFIQYYKETLKDFTSDNYAALIDLLDHFINCDIKINLSFDDNRTNHQKDIDKILVVNRKAIEESKNSDDYNLLKDKIELIYKGFFNDFDGNLKRELDNYLLHVYEERKKNSSDFFDNIIVNDLSYGLYKDFISKEKKYKEKYDKLYAKNQVVKPNDVNIAPRFRKKLIRLYYDVRFSFNDEKSLKSIGEKINGLKALAKDLESAIWEYILFKSSHSDYIRRNNSVRYAIINSLYNLYNPYDLLDRYECVRNKLLSFLNSNKDLSNKMEIKMYGVEGLIDKNSLLNNIINKRYAFILDNAFDNISSKTKDYDTRDYDLFYIARDLDVSLLVELYKELARNNKIENRCLIEFISQAILLVNNPNYSLDNPDYEMVGDVAREYLNVEYSVELDDCVYIGKRDKFNIAYESYLKSSSFHKLKGDFRI